MGFTPKQQKLFDAIRKMKADGLDDTRIREFVDFAVKKDPELSLEPQESAPQPKVSLAPPKPTQMRGALGAIEAQAEERGLPKPSTVPTGTMPDITKKEDRVSYLGRFAKDFGESVVKGFEQVPTYLNPFSEEGRMMGEVARMGMANESIENRQKTLQDYPRLATKSGADVFTNPTDLDAWTAATANMIPTVTAAALSMIPAVGPSVAGNVLGASYMASSLSDNYAEGLKSGLTDNQATAYGTIMGSIEAAFEKLGFDKMVQIPKSWISKEVKEAARQYGKEGAEQGVKAVMAKVAKEVAKRGAGFVQGGAVGFAEEAGTSLGQSGTQLAFDAATGGNLFDPNGTVNNIPREIASRALSAGAEGILGQGVFGAVRGIDTRDDIDPVPAIATTEERQAAFVPPDEATPTETQYPTTIVGEDFNPVAEGMTLNPQTGLYERPSTVFEGETLEYNPQTGELSHRPTVDNTPMAAMTQATDEAEDALTALADDLSQDNVVATEVTEELPLTEAQKRAKETMEGYKSVGAFDEGQLGLMQPLIEQLEDIADEVAQLDKVTKADKLGLLKEANTAKKKGIEKRKKEIEAELKRIASTPTVVTPVVATEEDVAVGDDDLLGMADDLPAVEEPVVTPVEPVVEVETPVVEAPVAETPVEVVTPQAEAPVTEAKAEAKKGKSKSIIRVNGEDLTNEDGEINQSFIDKIESLKEANDREGIDTVWQTVNTVLNGIAQKRGGQVVRAFEAIRNDLSNYALLITWRERYKKLEPYRRSKLFEAVANEAKSDKDLKDLLNVIVKNMYNESRILWAIASNPNSSKETFEDAVSRRALRKMTDDENIQRLREKRFPSSKAETPVAEAKKELNQKPNTDEKANEEPLLEGLRDGGQQDQGRKESPELRPQEAQGQVTAADFAAIEAKGQAGRKARQALSERVGKDVVADMTRITAKFESIITALEKEGKIRKQCP